MPQLRNKWAGHDASLEGFPVLKVLAELDVLLDRDDALVDEDLGHPHGVALIGALLGRAGDEVPRPGLLARRVLLAGRFGQVEAMALLSRSNTEALQCIRQTECNNITKANHNIN